MKLYSREKKNIMINETISVDFMGKYNILHEVKKSKSIEEAGEWQIKYYMYYLKQNNVIMEKGIIDYPRLRERKEVYLTKEDETKIEEIINEINNLKMIRFQKESIVKYAKNVPIMNFVIYKNYGD